MSLITSEYNLTAYTKAGVKVDLTRYILSMSLSWGLSASRASAKITLAPEAKPILSDIKRGSAFTITWGYSSKNRVNLFWIGTSWTIAGTVNIDLVHKSWELLRNTTRAIMTNTDPKALSKNLGKSKGVKVVNGRATDSNGSNKNTIAVNQSISKEIQRQHKGDIILNGQSGSEIEIVSLSNITKTAQVHYISPEFGLLENITITYKAKVNKDKSYAELSGGEKAISAPNAESSTSPNEDKPIVELAKENYAILNNTILSLIIDGKPVAKYNVSLTGTKPSNKDYTLSKDKNVLMTNGGFTIGLGINRDEAFRIIVQNKIRKLTVTEIINPVVEEKAVKSDTKKASLLISKDGRSVLSSNNAGTVFPAIGSVAKIFIAIYYLRTFYDATLFQTLLDGVTITEHLQLMLDKSSNESANVLLRAIDGGYEGLNQFLKSNGYVNTKITGTFSDAVFTNKESTATDVANCFVDIFRGTSEFYILVQKALVGQSFRLEGETHTKSGITSRFQGSVSLFNNKQILVVFSTSESDKISTAKRLLRL